MLKQTLSGFKIYKECRWMAVKMWETNDKVDRRSLRVSYPRWYEWAYKPEGIKQVGCIYTSQGYEFDYAGVIIGPDLKYDPVEDKIITDKSACKDPVLKRTQKEATMTFDDYVRNIYRVLMSRGMKGCYLYVCDKELRKYLKELINEMKS